jgi:acetyl esterase
MASKLAEDPRLDPRVKAVFGSLGLLTDTGDVASREDLLAAANSESGKKQAAAMAVMLDAFDDETVAPSAGLSIRTERVVSAPDDNTINIQFIRPDNATRVPCAYRNR